jgi:hypothetical protein
MPTALLANGPNKVSLERDDEDHYFYTASWLVGVLQNTSGPPYTVGPNEATMAAGLPLPGSPWIYEDVPDLNVYCLPRVSVKRQSQIHENHPVNFWELTFTFSDNLCGVVEHMDPLLRPQKMSGSSIKFVEEATVDRFGVPIQNSSYEQYRGQMVEFDNNRPQIIVEQNVPFLELDMLAKLVDMVSDSEMWGFPRRCVKFSDYSWRQECRGAAEPYFVRRLTFDINVKVKQNTTEDDFDHLISGFDRDLPDEGTKVLKGHWSNGKWVLDQIGVDSSGNPIMPDWRNPTHFMRVIDTHGNPTKIPLNGRGEPWDPDWTPPMKYWCIRAMNPPIVGGTSTSSTVNGTCTEAISQLDSMNDELPNHEFKLYGPYNDQATADATCNAPLDQVKNSDEYDRSFCSGDQGKWRIEKYDEADLFDYLGVPTEIGNFTPYTVATTPLVGP